MLAEIWALIIALGLTFAWIPILLRFFRSWRGRANPISLAICFLVGLAQYVPAYVAIAFPPSWSTASILGMDGITCLAFHGAILWASRRFADTRNSNGAG